MFQHIYVYALRLPYIKFFYDPWSLPSIGYGLCYDNGSSLVPRQRHLDTCSVVYFWIIRIKQYFPPHMFRPRRHDVLASELKTVQHDAFSVEHVTINMCKHVSVSVYSIRCGGFHVCVRKHTNKMHIFMFIQSLQDSNVAKSCLHMLNENF